MAFKQTRRNFLQRDCILMSRPQLWERTGSCSFEPQGYYSPQICPKFISADGKKLKVFTAGDWNNDLFYRLTIVPIEIIDK